MNKKILASILFLLNIVFLDAQVGINTSDPKPGTSLHIEGSDEGLLINRVALTGTDDTTTISTTLDTTYEGLMVYNTFTSSNADPETDVIPGFYTWEGTRWKAVAEQKRDKKGWVALTDGDYSLTLNFVESSLLSDFSNFVNIDLDFTNDASDSSIEGFAPDGYDSSDFYDDTINRITPIELGDTVILRFQFDAIPLQNNGVIVIQIDIGANDIPGDGDDIVIYQKSIPLVRGGTRESNISETIMLYQLGTFLANGGKIRMAYTRSNNTAGSTCDVDSFGIVFKRLD